MRIPTNGLVQLQVNSEEVRTQDIQIQRHHYPCEGHSYRIGIVSQDRNRIEGGMILSSHDFTQVLSEIIRLEAKVKTIEEIQDLINRVSTTTDEYP